MLFWSSLWILRALWTNKFLFGEFHAFSGKNDHYRLWASPWNFGGKNKVEQYEIVLFVILGTYTLSMDWVAFLVG